MHKKREALTSFTQLTVHVSFFRFCIRFCLQGFKFWLWFSRRCFRVRVYQASPVFSPRWPRVCLAHVFANRRLVQTLIVLLEWLLPLLEDVRLSANQRDIIAMFRDHLRDLEAEMQRQACEMREHILGRYHRSLQG